MMFVLIYCSCWHFLSSHYVDSEKVCPSSTDYPQEATSLKSTWLRGLSFKSALKCHPEKPHLPLKGCSASQVPLLYLGRNQISKGNPTRKWGRRLHSYSQALVFHLLWLWSCLLCEVTRRNKKRSSTSETTIYIDEFFLCFLMSVYKKM